MEPAEFKELVRRMRECQKNYFRTRTTEALRESKSLERQVDEALSFKPSKNSPSMFGGEK